MKKCTSCQTVLDDSARFCSQCGGSSFAPVQAQTPAAPKKKGLIAALASAVVVILAVIVLISVLANPVNKFIDSLESGDYAAASEVYYEKISTSPNKYQKLCEETSLYLEELMENFRNESASYELTIGNIEAIDQLGILGYPLDMQWYEVDSLHTNRAIYAEAEAALSAGHYADAISLYDQLLTEEYPVGENLQEKRDQAADAYREQIVGEVNALVEKQDYESALFVLDNAFYVLPYDETLMQLQVSCLDAQYQQLIQGMIDQARMYMNGKDFVAALTHLDTCMVDFPSEVALQTERVACLEAFEAYVYEESLKLAREDKFQHALSLAESGLNYFESLRVTELSVIYKSHLPVVLGEMEIFKNSSKGGSWASNTNKTNEYLEDSYGNTYANSLSVGCGSLTYLLNFKYKTLSGTVAFPKGLTCDNARSSATLTILGDDKEIAKFTDVKDTTKPQTFTVDVSSYEKVTFKWKCDGYNVWGDWGDFATIFDGQFLPIPLDLPEGQ